MAVEPANPIQRQALMQIEVPQLKLTNTPLDQAVVILQKAANDAKRGGQPVQILVEPGSRFVNPTATFDIRDQNLDTLLEFFTEHVGFEWRIAPRSKIIEIYTTAELRAKHPRLRAMPGRPKLRATIIPHFKVEGVEMARALKLLETAARQAGVGQITRDGGVLKILTNYNPRPGHDYLVTAEFHNTDVDTIVEILTKQTQKLDWTIEKGNIVVFDKATAEARRNGGNRPRKSAPADAFADPFADLGPSIPQPPLPPQTPAAAEQTFNTESYETLQDNPFLSPHNEPLSTFSIDVDTASYSNVRRLIRETGQKPPVGAVRIEELVNYFDYDYTPPKRVENPVNPEVPVEHPFATEVEIANAPWKPRHRLVRIGLKGYELEDNEAPASNLVFLLDVSGSMGSPNKLPLVKESMKLLANQLRPKDRVSIVVYAGASGLVLEPTSGRNRNEIKRALDRLQSGGGTNGGQGIQLAYKVATENLIEDGNNRVILCTDGDFNLGTTDNDSLKEMVEDNAKKGVQLTILGFGMGNLKDDRMELLTNAGDGNYGYIDSRREAEKLFVQQLTGTLFMIAKDVKIQVEFNPRNVAAYRLIGYENRRLRNQDFDNDKIDAGDIGAGHTVTVLYEIVPPGVEMPDQPGAIELKYQETNVSGGDAANELLTLKLRYKWPKMDESRLLEYPIIDNGGDFGASSPDFQFAASVAGFGMLLRDSPHVGDFTFDDVVSIASSNRGADPFEQRGEFVNMAKVFVW